MKNATIILDPQNLSFKLVSLQARFASSFTAEIQRVPHEVSEVFIRIFRAGTDAYFDCPATSNANGDYLCYIIGTCFPTVGRSYYEIHAHDENGNDTSLGAGDIEIKPFSVNGELLGTGATITVAKIPDDSGVYHAIRAVNLGTREKPDWTWQIDSQPLETTDENHPCALMPDGLGALHQIRAKNLDGDFVPQTKLVNGEN